MSARITITLPTEAWHQLRRNAEGMRVTPEQMALHQLVRINELPLRQRRMLELRKRIFDLWVHQKLSGPKIAVELGISLGTVDKHKRAIRDEWSKHI
jgi:DNA-directed RNA polymerase specialized sigma24 family protein